MPKYPSNQMKRRIVGVGTGLCCLGFLVVLVRLFFLQVVDAEEWQTRAIKQQLRSTSINANRGTIYDRNQKVLAKSANVWTVFISPADIKGEEDAAKIASGLSKILGVDEDKILEKSKKKGSYYEIIKQKVERTSCSTTASCRFFSTICCIVSSIVNTKLLPSLASYIS